MNENNDKEILLENEIEKDLNQYLLDEDIKDKVKSGITTTKEKLTDTKKSISEKIDDIKSNRFIISSADIAKKFGNAVANQAEKAGQTAIKLGQTGIEEFKNLSEKEVISKGLGPVDQIFDLIKRGICILAFPVSPLITIIGLSTTKACSRNIKQENRVKLYYDYKSKLAIVNSKLADMEHKDFRGKEAKLAEKEKYSLMKIKGSLEYNMAKLNNYYKEVKSNDRHERNE